jgi:hypothetical protein
MQTKGLDLEYETEPRGGPEAAPEPALYETAYVTSHKSNCRAGAFSTDGSLVATGSVDASIKILDVDRMLAKSHMESMAASNKSIDPGSHPVIRTLYDHVEVNKIYMQSSLVIKITKIISLIDDIINLWRILLTRKKQKSFWSTVLFFVISAKMEFGHVINTVHVGSGLPIVMGRP